MTADLGRILSALGDPTRRSVLERLGGRAQAVGEVARGLPVSRPAVSQHLKVLKAARLVTDEQQGNRRIYSVDPEGIAALRAYLDAFAPRSGADGKPVAEAPPIAAPPVPAAPVPAAPVAAAPVAPTTKPRVTLRPVVRRADSD